MSINLCFVLWGLTLMFLEQPLFIENSPQNVSISVSKRKAKPFLRLRSHYNTFWK